MPKGNRGVGTAGAPGARVVGQREGDVGFTTHQVAMRVGARYFPGKRPEGGYLKVK